MLNIKYLFDKYPRFPRPIFKVTISIHILPMEHICDLPIKWTTIDQYIIKYTILCIVLHVLK